MTARRARGYASRLHEIREDTRREKAAMPPAEAYCVDAATHERFHRLLRGNQRVCTICGPAPSDR